MALGVEHLVERRIRVEDLTGDVSALKEWYRGHEMLTLHANWSGPWCPVLCSDTCLAVAVRVLFGCD